MEVTVGVETTNFCPLTYLLGPFLFLYVIYSKSIKVYAYLVECSELTNSKEETTAATATTDSSST